MQVRFVPIYLWLHFQTYNNCLKEAWTFYSGVCNRVGTRQFVHLKFRFNSDFGIVASNEFHTPEPESHKTNRNV
jgi:hypothetical protein